MEKIDIQNKVKELKTTNDLAQLLMAIKEDELGTRKYKITPEQLYHFSYVKSPNRYKTFQIRKKNGGTREINAPCYQLKMILYVLNIMLKSVYKPNSSVMGFTEGRSIVDNASIHVGHNYVFNIDLENFFPSIPQARVRARLMVPPFNFPQEIANIIAGLCCHLNVDKTENVLPQGSPTSPLLTNAICDRLDMKMRKVAKKYGLHYSRYADDMTFSSMHNVYQPNSDFRNDIQRVISEEHFKMNEKKTRLLKNDERQEVTGITVNEKVNVARKYIRDLRCILHKWESQGYGEAYAYFYPHYKHEKGYIKKGEPIIENVIEGKLNYLRMVRGGNDDSYKKLRSRYERLQLMVFMDEEADKDTKMVYVWPYTINEFEHAFDTRIKLEITPKNKLVGKCVLGGMDKTIMIAKRAQNELCNDIQSKTIGQEIISDKLNDCYITLCRKKGKNFWFMTESMPKRSKCLSIQSVNIDTDALLNLWEEMGIEYAAKQFHRAIIYGTPITTNDRVTKKRELSFSINTTERIPDNITSELNDELVDIPLDILD